jgi:hypothetical protein
MEQPNKLTKYQKQKKAILKWRETHQDEFYETNLPHLYKWREKNKVQYNAIARKSKRWKRIQRVFLDILI